MFSQFVSLVKSSRVFSELRKIKYRSKRKNLKQIKKLRLIDIRDILVNQLNIVEGDSLIIHCGFGFLNADFTPEELINLLKNIVGCEGNLMMPFYPPGLSNNWANSQRVFERDKIRCSTGVLSQKFSNDESTLLSIHPIKAVLSWGNNKIDLVKDHELTEYPFDKLSPYYKLAMLKGSKSIGLGVRNCAMLHCAEDLFESNKNYLYTKNKIQLKVLTPSGMKEVPTHYHHGEIKLQQPYEFIDQHCSDSVTLVNKSSVTYYAIDNKSFLDKCSVLFENGVNRKCL